MKTLEIGDSIPDFKLIDQYGKEFRSADHKGKKLVIYFYPKDESAVCTAEACAFRDSFEDFAELGAGVIGINAASVASHLKFAEKNRLPFKLLSDPGNTVLKQFGIKPWLFLTGRETFIVDEDGRIVYKYRAFLDGKGHSEKILQHLA
jgi:peroxiredoxin Q/BCP